MKKALCLMLAAAMLFGIVIPTVSYFGDAAAETVDAQQDEPSRLISSGVTVDSDPSDGYYSGDYLVIYNPDESDNGSSIGVSFGGLIETGIS